MISRTHFKKLQILLWCFCSSAVWPETQSVSNRVNFIAYTDVQKIKILSQTQKWNKIEEIKTYRVIRLLVLPLHNQIYSHPDGLSKYQLKTTIPINFKIFQIWPSKKQIISSSISAFSLWMILALLFQPDTNIGIFSLTYNFLFICTLVLKNLAPFSNLLRERMKMIVFFYFL